MTSVLLVEVKIFALIFSVHHIDLSNSVVFKSEKMVCFLTDMLHCFFFNTQNREWETAGV